MKVKEPNGMHYVSYHNVYFVQNLIKNIRTSIKEDRFKQFKKEFLGNYVKP
jgi:queuine tRNA-ribosyltransferase